MPRADLEPFLAFFRAEGGDSWTLSFPEMRAQMEALTGKIPLPPGVEAQQVDAGGVPAQWIVDPRARADRALLWLHGGGYVVGSMNTEKSLVASLSRACRLRVLAIDYRLAPENPHPAALEDAVAAYRHLLDRGYAPAEIAIGGASAGGGLAVASVVAIRDAGLEGPGACLCLSPWVDLECTGESHEKLRDLDPILRDADMRRCVEAYTSDPRLPSVSPIHADLAGLPPLLIQVGTHEVLLDDARTLEARARRAGLDVTLQEYEGMVHVFQVFPVPETREAMSAIGQFLEARLG